MKAKNIMIVAALSVSPGLLYAQFDFTIDGKKVQVHSFASQGFMYSNDNNFLSAPTSKGTFAFTDGGVNISSQITEKFRVGAQLYMRNMGELGNWRPELDWAYGDYKFKSWFGIRAGRVKTTLGLFNDIQDMDSLHTFALLPEAAYPLDWRSSTIAHSGGDIYGDFTVKHMGVFSYTGYAGMRPQDPTSGYLYAWKAYGVNFSRLGGRQAGGDLRLTMPFGAVVGASYLNQDLSGSAKIGSDLATATPYGLQSNTDAIQQLYAQYTFKRFRLDTEHRKNLRDYNLLNYAKSATPSKSMVDQRGWYVAGTFRVSKHLELGAYRSQYYVDTRKDTTPPAAHQFDTAISGRINLVHNWYLKVEGHFLDGAPTTPTAARGFYTLSNPNGLAPTTNLLVIRTGISF